MDFDEVLEKIVETLRREYAPEKVILFGSHARGEAGPDSDVDLLIVKDTKARLIERIVEVSRLLREYQMRPHLLPLEILVKTPDEVNEQVEAGDSFMSEVMREGRVLYDRAA